MSRKEARVRYERNSSAAGLGRSSNAQEEIRIYDNPFNSYYPVDGHHQHEGHFRCLRRKRGLFFYIKDTCYPLRRAGILVGCCVVTTMIILFVLNAMEFCSLTKSKPEYCYTQECVKTAAFLLTGMDQTVDPCEDFFQYACGMWNRIHVIPEDRSSINPFEVLADQLQHVLRRLLEDPISSRDNLATQKAKKIYKSCINTTEIKLNGVSQMKAKIESLGGWPVADPNWRARAGTSIESLLGEIKRQFNDAVMFGFWIGADDKNSSTNIIQIDQLQLALPNRDYYLNGTDKLLNAYYEFMAEIATLYGADTQFARSEMKAVLEFETELARICVPETKRVDNSAIYLKLTFSELQERVPQLNWTEYLTNVLQTNIQPQEPIVCYSIQYFVGLGKVLSRSDRRTVQNYLIWRVIMEHFLPHFAGPYEQSRLAYKKILLGISTERNRWMQCIEYSNKKMGMAVGSLFIRENFNTESKESATEMIKNIRNAFNDLLNENTWMDEETKRVAKEKADAIEERIGYPDILMKPDELEAEYRQLNVSEDHFFVNTFNIQQYECAQNLDKLRKPVDQDRWITEPAVVNAFYSPNKNDIVFPAGILQPFFYSKYFPKSVNYGGIGVVIGHEITHGFDDKGRQFDKHGNMNEWWNNATIEKFKKQIQCIIDQYSAYRVDEAEMNLNGIITQGENIADNGGLKQSFRAYRRYVQLHGEEPLLPGLNLTNEQLFFVNYAQIWCGSMRPEEAVAKVRSSSHSPGRLRVIGPLSNSYDFADVFNCRLGAPMNPPKKCVVW